MKNYVPITYGGGTHVYYITTDEAIKNIAKINAQLVLDNSELQNDSNAIITSLNKKINELEHPKLFKPEKPEESIEDIKNMSIWQFMKWRKNNKI
jgi:KaiC/GvpD/RAD55 family RecA-like ATPase